jgi:DNA-binding NtrC family response regulator
MSLPPILVVDDEPDMRTALSHALRRSGFNVESAASGTEALTKFRPDKYSLVISDVKLPGMSGMEILDRIKNQSQQIPVVMITAFGTIDNAVEAMQAGACDYILKPFSLETLEATVKKILGNSNGNGQAKSAKKPSAGVATFKQIITNDAKLDNILKLAKNVAPSKSTVLIQGESGTGKELLAAFIHSHSSDPQAPYVAVNCAALPETLAESELFGHEKGAFTGAAVRKIGKFELAEHGTVVLDEISEMALQLQAKLLRVLQEREVDRIGGSRPIPIDARVIAISNIDLKKAVAEGKFRQDLYYRVNVVPLRVPPLRERVDDIAPLAVHFLEKYCSMNNKNLSRIADETFEKLVNCDWQGNIRELENTIERAVLVCDGDVVLPEHLILEESGVTSTGSTSIPIKAGVSVRDMEKKLIFKTLNEVNDNRTHAAELLGISIRTLRNKLREYKAEMAA